MPRERSDYEIVQDWVDAQARMLADQTWKKLCLDPFYPHYLYFTPSTATTWGVLTVAPEQPDGMQLAWNDRVPCDITRERLVDWMRARIGKLSVIPSGPLKEAR